MTGPSTRFDAYGVALTFDYDDNNDFQLPHNFDNTDDLSSLLGSGTSRKVSATVVRMLVIFLHLP